MTDNSIQPYMKPLSSSSALKDLRGMVHEMWQVRIVEEDKSISIKGTPSPLINLPVFFHASFLSFPARNFFQRSCR
jgi:hypothetical protein